MPEDAIRTSCASDDRGNIGFTSLYDMPVNMETASHLGLVDRALDVFSFFYIFTLS